MSVYLDYNASAPLRPQALSLMTEILAETGNPSSIHAAGRKARSRVEVARSQVASLIGASAQDVVFTGSGTEANALGIHSALAAGLTRLLVNPTEHASVLETVRHAGLPTEWIGIAEDGLVRADAIERSLLAGGPALVVVQFANSETGIIQPIQEIAEVCRRHGSWLHVDAVQVIGRIEISVGQGAGHWGDSWAISAHKFGGPQGVGALINLGSRTLMPDLRGGGQERGLRAGTENVAAIAGFGAAADAARQDICFFAQQSVWRDAALERMKSFGAIVIAPESPKLANVLAVGVEGWPSSLQVMALDLAGVMISAGSACSSGKVTRSPVLDAMGLESLAAGSIRASGGWATTEADWTRFTDQWIEAFQAYRSRRQERAA